MLTIPPNEIMYMLAWESNPKMVLFTIEELMSNIIKGITAKIP